MNRRGIVLAFSFGMLLLLTLLGMSSLCRSAYENQVSRLSTSAHRALALAEASLDDTIWNLHVGSFGDLPSTPLSGGTYWAEVVPTGVTLQYLVTSHGLYESMQRTIEAVTQLVETSVFQFALFGSDQLVVSGDMETDSFDSSAGAYDPTNPGHNGDIGTNSAALGGITVDGGVLINGSVAVGPDADPSVVIDINGGSLIVTGSPTFVSQPAPMPMPPVVVPAGLSCPNLTINGGTTRTLSSAVGEYCFHNLQLNGGGELSADGPVTVYITGELYAAGNTIMGVPSDPTYLTMLISSSRQATIESGLTGTTAFYGGLYGPNATIEIGGTATVYGSVVADRVEVPGNAQIHYDEALGALTGPTGFYRVRVLSWREQ